MKNELKEVILALDYADMRQVDYNDSEVIDEICEDTDLDPAQYPCFLKEDKQKLKEFLEKCLEQLETEEGCLTTIERDEEDEEAETKVEMIK